MSDLLVHAIQHYCRMTIDPRGGFGTLQELPRSKIEDRMAVWSLVLRGWCPRLLKAETLIVRGGDGRLS